MEYPWVLPQDLWQWQMDEIMAAPFDAASFDSSGTTRPIGREDWALLLTDEGMQTCRFDNLMLESAARAVVVDETAAGSYPYLGVSQTYPTYPLQYYQPANQSHCYYWWPFPEPNLLYDTTNHSILNQQLVFPTPPSTAISEPWPEPFLYDMGSASSQLAGDLAEAGGTLPENDSPEASDPDERLDMSWRTAPPATADDFAASSQLVVESVQSPNGNAQSAGRRTQDGTSPGNKGAERKANSKRKVRKEVNARNSVAGESEGSKAIGDSVSGAANARSKRLSDAHNNVNGGGHGSENARLPFSSSNGKPTASAFRKGKRVFPTPPLDTSEVENPDLPNGVEHGEVDQAGQEPTRKKRANRGLTLGSNVQKHSSGQPALSTLTAPNVSKSKRKRRGEHDHVMGADPDPNGALDVRSAKKQKRKERPSDSSVSSGKSSKLSTKPTQKSKTLRSLNGERIIPSIEENLPSNGPFTPREIELLSIAIENYRQEHDFTQHELNEKIQTTGKGGAADAFWKEVVNVLPQRSRQSVYRVVRRRWHNYSSRGRWEPDEDQMLREAYAAKPNKWKAIGAMIGRMPEDCRDRWRNYLKCEGTMRKDVWCEEEEHALIDAVRECMEAIEEAQMKEQEQAEEELEQPDPWSLLNWSVISDKLGGQRSRLQCLYKWRSLKQRLKNQLSGDEAMAGALINGESASDQGKEPSWRVKRGEKNYERMLPGDKWRIICDIADSGTYEEKNIPWKLILRKRSSDMWTSADRKVALQEMKKLVPPQHDLRDWVTAIMDYLENTYPGQLGQFQQSGMPSPVETPKKRVKSSKFVDDSDDDESERGNSEPDVTDHTPDSMKTGPSRISEDTDQGGLTGPADSVLGDSDVSESDSDAD